MTDEAMFYLGGSYGRRRVCYIRKGHNDPSKLKFVKRDSFAPGFMAWGGVSFHGKTEIWIIPKGVRNFILTKFWNHSLKMMHQKCFEVIK